MSGPLGQHAHKAHASGSVGWVEPLVLNGILPWPFGIKGGCRVSSRHPWWVARPVAVVLLAPVQGGELAVRVRSVPPGSVSTPCGPRAMSAGSGSTGLTAPGLTAPAFQQHQVVATSSPLRHPLRAPVRHCGCSMRARPIAATVGSCSSTALSGSTAAGHVTRPTAGSMTARAQHTALRSTAARPPGT